ncbi:MAG: hypothetical protein JRM84_07160 [Nitrososphaerota archaeon]|nr:hypothetical protein [Nitrososphaerota archaeon]MDG6926999.1 hypothetical protein [Nitrososphaerota archaeon]MDG6944773.1 hypothetical protein [Nitrososphaerota archaeon]
MKVPSCKFMLIWTFSWAVALTAIIPVINYVTPLLNPSYNNVYTPDVFWRLVLYWHGAIFIPLITSLAVLMCSIFGLYDIKGWPGALIRDSVFIGGVVAVPLAGIAGIFDVYDRFAFGLPLWSQIAAFLIGDEMAVALIVAFLSKVGKSNRLNSAVSAFMGFAVFLTLISAFMGHIAGWITWFGPWPSFASSYINQTMYPVLGFYNTTSVATFTENVVTSHSHLMLPVIMAGIVVMVAAVYGFGSSWKGIEKRLTVAGIAIMALAMLTAAVIYIISGVGNYVIPTLFSSGPNGVNGLAMDDLITGIIGLGALFVFAALVINRRKNLVSDPLFLSLIVGWLLIYLTIPVTGYWIEFHEAFYGAAGALPGAAGALFDAAYTRFHQDFAFFLLPSLVTAIMAFEIYGISGRNRTIVGYLFLSGEIIAFVFGELYSLIFLSLPFIVGAAFGLALIMAGVVIGIIYLHNVRENNT